MPDMLDNTLIGIPCKNCARVTQKSIGWVNRSSDFTCARGTRITLDKSQFVREIAKANDALSALQKMLKNRNK